MIEVTLSEEKRTKDKPFPKLMISDLGQVIIALSLNVERDTLVGFLIKSNGYEIGGNGFTEGWCKSSFTDYNGSVTIQNI